MNVQAPTDASGLYSEAPVHSRRVKAVGGVAESGEDTESGSPPPEGDGRGQPDLLRARPGRAWVRWTAEEHATLEELVKRFGCRSWSLIASHIPGRTGKQCRERWLNHTTPESKRGTWSHDEEYILVMQHAQVGSQWCRISKHLAGRNDNAVKNHWNATYRSKTVAKHPSMLWLYCNELKAGRSGEAALQAALVKWENNVPAHTVMETLGFWPSEKYGVPGGEAAGALARRRLAAEAAAVKAAGLPGAMPVLSPAEAAARLNAVRVLVPHGVDGARAGGMLPGGGGGRRAMPAALDATCSNGGGAARPAAAQRPSEDSVTSHTHAGLAVDAHHTGPRYHADPTATTTAPGSPDAAASHSSSGAPAGPAGAAAQVMMSLPMGGVHYSPAPHQVMQQLVYTVGPTGELMLASAPQPPPPMHHQVLVDGSGRVIGRAAMQMQAPPPAALPPRAYGLPGGQTGAPGLVYMSSHGGPAAMAAQAAAPPPPMGSVLQYVMQPMPNGGMQLVPMLAAPPPQHPGHAVHVLHSGHPVNSPHAWQLPETSNNNCGPGAAAVTYLQTAVGAAGQHMVAAPCPAALGPMHHALPTPAP